MPKLRKWAVASRESYLTCPRGSHDGIAWTRDLDEARKNARAMGPDWFVLDAEWLRTGWAVLRRGELIPAEALPPDEPKADASSAILFAAGGSDV